ncbi:hypothetical protein D9757_010795 [Collybiopsis confluens]|uniref:Uncharacterized protein n=1 Tax=Collybiopsis confluens TaxID=2823264 RepID=A0A8H5GUI9_9AGAR|nr:hypothetical protein D9757_010795 [Collybiopsis confluens]
MLMGTPVCFLPSIMTETAAPQIFTGASRFDISNSVFIATSNPTTVSNIANETRPTISDPYILSSSRSNIIEEEKDDNPPVESEVYARLLLPRKKGYPLWKPKPDENLPEDYRRFGVRIGDVGFLGDGGGFEYLFNACHPADHPINLHRVPRDFEPLLTINDRNISGSTQEYSPGDHVPSSFSHIFKYRISYASGERPVPRVSSRVGAGFTFTSTAPKGALLIIPEGGSKTDHQKLNEFRAYAAKHAQSWYAHVNGPMARGVHNGAIYFVTGFDKTRAWGVASFIDAKPSDVSLEFVPSQSAQRGGPPDYWFRTSHAASSSSDADDVFENRSGCIFLRGFKIAIRIPPFKTEVGTTVSYISNLETEDLLPKPKSTGFYVPPPKWWLMPYLVPRASPESTSRNWQMTEGESSGSDFPIRYPVYHPSDVINQWILSQDEKIDIAITHDCEWAKLISEASKVQL